MPNIRPAVVAELDQDWAEAREWFEGSLWTRDMLKRFCQLLACETEELRRTATEDELNCIQRLGRLAFYETWKLSLDAVDDELTD